MTEPEDKIITAVHGYGKSCYEDGIKAAALQCYQIAQSHEFGPDAAKAIRETFGLEI